MEIKKDLDESGYSEAGLFFNYCWSKRRYANYVKLKQFLDIADVLKELHVAAVVGDTNGDPLKDTSGPAINILVKFSAITSLVYWSFIKDVNFFWLR